MPNKQLPCRICGTPVVIPAKYPQSRGAVCSKCSIERLKKLQQDNR